MDLFSWYLVIALSNSDELMVKEMPSKKECIKSKNEFMKKFKGKMHDIDSVTCEEGTVMESTTVKKENEEYL